MDLKGKTAVVVGGTSGIGRATALMLAGQGNNRMFVTNFVHKFFMAHGLRQHLAAAQDAASLERVMKVARSFGGKQAAP